MRIAGVERALPPHYYNQNELLDAFAKQWGERHYNLDRLRAIHNNVLVGGRHLALPIERYDSLRTFGAANDAFISVATDLAEKALVGAARQAGLALRDIDHIFFASVTGIATPSIEARLANRIALRRDLKRTPIFGLGCVAGAAGISRAADYVRAYPTGVAALICVELCSLTLQRDDLSVANIVASGLFGDGAAAVLLVGNERPADGPTVVATRSVFYPNSEDVMGWKISERGFGVVLSANVPEVVQEHLGADVDAFLSAHSLTRADIESYVCHPGGPRVLMAMQEALGVQESALELTWRSLREVGNLSSASVLFVLQDTLVNARPRKGAYGLLLAMGPGFCAELVLLRW